jgi:hypothetical protein
MRVERERNRENLVIREREREQWPCIINILCRRRQRKKFLCMKLSFKKNYHFEHKGQERSLKIWDAMSFYNSEKFRFAASTAATFENSRYKQCSQIDSNSFWLSYSYFSNFTVTLLIDHDCQHANISIEHISFFSTEDINYDSLFLDLSSKLFLGHMRQPCLSEFAFDYIYSSTMKLISKKCVPRWNIIYRRKKHNMSVYNCIQWAES